jgi:ribosomal-protein-alanine N-acetyltransferase
MRECDLARVVAIERQAYEFPWTEGIFADCLRVGYCCWVAERDRRIDAYSIMNVGAGESHILNLCVRPAAQGQGIGRTLLEHMLGVAMEHHADIAYLEVRPSNRAAIRLYLSAGFAAVGTRRGYYPAAHGREDAMILSRPIGNPAPDVPDAITTPRA